MNNIYYILRHNVKRLINTLYWSSKNKDKLLFLNSATGQHLAKNVKYNFGDDLNYYLLKEITDRTIVNVGSTFYKEQKNYLVIGSIIEKLCNSSSIIWGAGAMYGTEKIRNCPFLVTAVRGGKTYEWLRNQDIECPAIFGDPALLLPYIYMPNVEKKYKLGIIPHYTDMQSAILKEIVISSDDITVLPFVGYNNWRQLIDKMMECEYILSSSLHGLIISDAYDIPNIWIKMGSKIKGGNFKFYDYFSSVGRLQDSPLEIKTVTDIHQILHNLPSYTPICFNALNLVNACPFPLKSSFVEAVNKKTTIPFL